MALTIGTGPFAPRPAGTTNFTVEGPKHALWFEHTPKRVRVEFAGETVADSRDAKLLHETGHLPVYYIPLDDVGTGLLEATGHSTHCPFKGDASYWSVRVGDRVADNAVWGYPEPLEDAPPLAGHVAFYWDKMDRWLEEDDEVFIHARDPYHRLDVRQSSAHVVVRLDGQVVAESRRPKILFEAGLPPRYYLPADDVRTDLLEPTDSTSGCPYKGTASYWSVRVEGRVHDDLFWTYTEPYPEVATIKGLVSFYNEKVDLELDGSAQERPVTKFS